MRRTASPRVEGYAILAGAALLAALVLRRPELAVAAAPFALVLALGLRLARDPAVRVDLELAADRTLESSRLPAELSVRSESGVDRLELLVDLPEGVGVADGDNATAVRLRRGEERTLRAPGRWESPRLFSPQLLPCGTSTVWSCYGIQNSKSDALLRFVASSTA